MVRGILCPMSTKSMSPARFTNHIVGKFATINFGVTVSLQSVELGQGLRASRHFARGDIITQYDGEILTKTEAAQKPCKSHMISFGELVIDGIKVPEKGFGGASFANHADTDFNAKFIERDGSVFLKATRPIRPLEWIMCKYGSRYKAQMDLFSPAP